MHHMKVSGGVKGVSSLREVLKKGEALLVVNNWVIKTTTEIEKNTLQTINSAFLLITVFSLSKCSIIYMCFLKKFRQKVHLKKPIRKKNQLGRDCLTGQGRGKWSEGARERRHSKTQVCLRKVCAIQGF